MLRIIFGFILGCLVTYYSYPIVHGIAHKVTAFDSKELFTFSDEITTMNATPPSSTYPQKNQIQIQLSSASEIERLLKGIKIAKSSPSDSPASDFVIGLIQTLVHKDPSLSNFIRARIHNGLNNKEALEIFNHHLAKQA